MAGCGPSYSLYVPSGHSALILSFRDSKVRIDMARWRHSFDDSPVILSRTQRRRQQRDHTRHSYLAMKSKLMAMLRPMPLVGIMSANLEQFRSDLFSAVPAGMPQAYYSDDLIRCHGCGLHLSAHNKQPGEVIGNSHETENPQQTTYEYIAHAATTACDESYELRAQQQQH